MLGQRAPPRSDVQKVSDCLKFITGDGGFRSFGQFLLALLDDSSQADHTVIHTVSSLLEEDHLRPLLNKIATHRLMKAKDDLQGIVPWYGFHPGNPQREGTVVSPRGHGILLRWAVDLILKEVDKEADKLVKPGSSFHCPDNWSWESLQGFSLQLQRDVAIQNSPIIWSVLTTMAIGKDHRVVNRREEGERDPWQVVLIVCCRAYYTCLNHQ